MHGIIRKFLMRLLHQRIDIFCITQPGQSPGQHQIGIGTGVGYFRLQANRLHRVENGAQRFPCSRRHRPAKQPSARRKSCLDRNQLRTNWRRLPAPASLNCRKAGRSRLPARPALRSRSRSRSRVRARERTSPFASLASAILASQAPRTERWDSLVSICDCNRPRCSSKARGTGLCKVPQTTKAAMVRVLSGEAGKDRNWPRSASLGFQRLGSLGPKPTPCPERRQLLLFPQSIDPADRRIDMVVELPIDPCKFRPPFELLFRCQLRQFLEKPRFQLFAALSHLRNTSIRGRRFILRELQGRRDCRGDGYGCRFLSFRCLNLGLSTRQPTENPPQQSRLGSDWFRNRNGRGGRNRCRFGCWELSTTQLRADRKPLERPVFSLHPGGSDARGSVDSILHPLREWMKRRHRQGFGTKRTIGQHPEPGQPAAHPVPGVDEVHPVEVSASSDSRKECRDSAI